MYPTEWYIIIQYTHDNTFTVPVPQATVQVLHTTLLLYCTVYGTCTVQCINTNTGSKRVALWCLYNRIPVLCYEILIRHLRFPINILPGLVQLRVPYRKAL